MIKRKPDMFTILAWIVAIGVIASVVMTDSTPADAEGRATGFVAREKGPGFSAR